MIKGYTSSNELTSCLLLSVVEIIVVIILEHGLGELEVVGGKLDGLGVSLLGDELDGLCFVVTGGLERLQGLFEGVVGARVGVDQLLDPEEHSHVVHRWKDLQLDGQGLTEAPASRGNHSEEELLFLIGFGWHSGVLDLDGDGKSEVGHASDHLDWHLDVLDQLGGLQANELASGFEGVVGVVAELGLDEDNLAGSAHEGSFFRAFHKSAPVELVDTTTVAMWTSRSSMWSWMSPKRVVWCTPMVLGTSPAPFSAASAAAPFLARTAAAPFLTRTARTAFLLRLTPGLHLLTEVLAPVFHLLGEGRLVRLAILIRHTWELAGSMESLAKFIDHLAEIERFLRGLLFLVTDLLVFVLRTAGGLSMRWATKPVWRWTMWWMVRWMMRWPMSEMGWEESMRWSVVALLWQA